MTVGTPFSVPLLWDLGARAVGQPPLRWSGPGLRLSRHIYLVQVWKVTTGSGPSTGLHPVFANSNDMQSDRLADLGYRTAGHIALTKGFSISMSVRQLFEDEVPYETAWHSTPIPGKVIHTAAPDIKEEMMSWHAAIFRSPAVSPERGRDSEVEAHRAELCVPELSSGDPNLHKHTCRGCNTTLVHSHPHKHADHGVRRGECKNAKCGLNVKLSKVRDHGDSKTNATRAAHLEMVRSSEAREVRQPVPSSSGNGYDSTPPGQSVGRTESRITDAGGLSPHRVKTCDAGEIHTRTL